MGKGTNTTTSSSQPNPFATNAYLNVLGRANSVAQTPYQPYEGETVAPINAQQTTGINSINQNAGFAQPYIQQAAGLATQASQPLTQQQIQQYQSPYTQSVVDATTNWFNNQNQQQQQNVLGNAASQGALGGDRVGVAQANLAAQQTASQAPIIAGLYNQSYNTGLQTAQQQQQNQANAAYSIGNLGVAGQNAALTGANAQVGAGSLQQQNQQQLLNALYGQYQIGQAFPYQQTQWLAGVDTGVGSQLGGSSQTTAPAPNQFAQYAGLGLAGASMFLKHGGGVRGFAPGGTVAESPFAGVGWIPSRAITMGRGAPAAPGVPNQQQPAMQKPADYGGKLAGLWNSPGGPMDISAGGVGGFSPSPVGSTGPMGMSPGAGLSAADYIFRNGGGVRGFDTGGGLRSESTEYEIARRGADSAARSPSWIGRAIWPEEMQIRDYKRAPYERQMQQTGGYAEGGPVRGFADGGTPLDFADRWAPVADAVRSGDFDPSGLNNTPIYTAGFAPARVADARAVPMPRERPAEADMAGFASAPDDGGDALSFAAQDRRGGPQVMGPQGAAQPDSEGVYPADAVMMPGNPLSDVQGALPFSAAGESTAGLGAAPARSGRGFNLGILPDNLRAPLLAAGLGMLASRSPNLGNAIGEGGLAGVGAYTQAKERELTHAEKQQTFGQQNRRIDLEAQRLSQAAEQARKHLAESSRHNLATEEHQSGVLGETRRQRDIAEMQPVTIGTTAAGLEIKAVRDPASGSYRIIEPTTGRLLPPGEALPATGKSSSGYTDPQTGRPINQGQEANADGVIPANAQLVSSGVPFDYSTDAPYIEKGMDVPKPGSVSGKSSTAVQTDAEYYLQTGKLPPVARGKSPVAIQQNNYRNAVQNYAGSLAQSRGLAPEQTAEMWRTAPGMLRFILGADGRSTVALGTAVRHLDTVQQLAQAWGANDIQAVNRIRALVSREFGSEAATNLEAAGRIVGPEIIKALGVAGAGTEHDRATASAQFSAATSPAQLAGAAQTVQKLLGGQLEGRKRQAMNAGVSEERFKSLIGDRPYEMLTNADKGGGSATTGAATNPADKQALDWANANPSDPRAIAIKKRLGAP